MVHGVTKSRTRLSDFTFFFHFHALEKAMATHSSALVWRIPGTAELGGLPSMGLHRVGHDWSDLAAAEPNISSCWIPRLTLVTGFVDGSGFKISSRGDGCSNSWLCITFTMMGTWTQPSPTLNCVFCFFFLKHLTFCITYSNFCLLYLILVFTVMAWVQSLVGELTFHKLGNMA